MAERARRLGGPLQVEIDFARGTEIRALVPAIERTRITRDLCSTCAQCVSPNLGTHKGSRIHAGISRWPCRTRQTSTWSLRST
jgi:hypothetical protein